MLNSWEIDVLLRDALHNFIQTRKNPSEYVAKRYPNIGCVLGKIKQVESRVALAEQLMSVTDKLGEVAKVMLEHKDDNPQIVPPDWNCECGRSFQQ